VAILSPGSVNRALTLLDEMGLKAWKIGEVTEDKKRVQILD